MVPRPLTPRARDHKSSSFNISLVYLPWIYSYVYLLILLVTEWNIAEKIESSNLFSHYLFTGRGPYVDNENLSDR